jgi:hypothetical protein
MVTFDEPYCCVDYVVFICLHVNMMKGLLDIYEVVLLFSLFNCFQICGRHGLEVDVRPWLDQEVHLFEDFPFNLSWNI